MGNLLEFPKKYEISRFFITKKEKGGKKQIGNQASYRKYYKFEDELFCNKAEISFSFKATFIEKDENGKKLIFTDGNVGNET